MFGGRGGEEGRRIFITLSLDYYKTGLVKIQEIIFNFSKSTEYKLKFSKLSFQYNIQKSYTFWNFDKRLCKFVRWMQHLGKKIVGFNEIKSLFESFLFLNFKLQLQLHNVQKQAFSRRQSVKKVFFKIL